jgi:hypothetical protein
LVATLGGCVAFDGYPQRATSPVEDLKQLTPSIDAAAVGACLVENSLACRNKIVAARMYAIDIQFSAFEETLFKDTRTAGFGATMATLGLTSAAALAGGGTSQVLSGIAAFIIGGREAFQKEVLAERTVIAIHTAMRAGRAQVALRLQNGLTQPIELYPLALGLNDLNEYYNAGTVLGALIGITETVGAKAQKAEEALQTRISFRPDPNAEKMRLLLSGRNADISSISPDDIAKIKACWPTAGVPEGTLLLDFFLQVAFAKQRELVVKCLKL